MHKIRTHKGAQRRFSISGSGKIMRAKLGSSHLRRNKPKRVKRAYSDMLELSPADRKRISRVIPYGVK